MRFLKIILAVAAFVITPIAFADTTFSFYGIAPNDYNNDGYPGLRVTGTFTASPDFGGNPNVWAITGVQGTVTFPVASGGGTEKIIGLVSANAYQPTTQYGFIYDNLFYSGLTGTLPSYALEALPDGFDYYGLLFATGDPVTGVNTNDYVNLFSNNVNGTVVPVFADNNYTYTNYAPFAASDPTAIPVIGSTAPAPAGFSITVTPTPEPSSLILLGTGVLGAAFAVRRKAIAVRA